MPSVYLETYGCQMNLADSELILGQLARAGYAQVADPAAADVILLNTCAIRERAEERVLGRVGDLARHKLRRPHVQIGLAGCMAQHLRERLLSGTSPLDFVVGPDGYRRLPLLLAGGDPFVEVRLDREETYADLEPIRDAGVRAWITVMRGCDKFCTFCVVPYVRGRERSVPAAAAIAQVEAAAAAGFREVVFLGQTVNAYRDGETDFGALLRRADRVDGIQRIRFTSPHPSDMSAAVVDAMATCPKVCPQLHLPVQSGADAVLARMERGYTVDDYLALVDRLRRAVPGLALTTDVIVGFPGETDADFEATLALMRAVRYDGAFMFKYSRREHTKAARWEETTSDEVKADRLQQVIALQEAISAEINATLVGQEVEVLVEGPAKRRPGWLAGKTPHFKTCVLPDRGVRPGALASVRVAETTAHTLLASG